MSTTGRPYWEWNSSYPDSGKDSVTQAVNIYRGLETPSVSWLQGCGLFWKNNQREYREETIAVVCCSEGVRASTRFAGVGGCGDSGMDPDKYEAVPIGITKEGHWLVGVGAQKMLPEVLKGGQRVMMTADPTDAALVRLDGSGGGQRLDLFSR